MIADEGPTKERDPIDSAWSRTFAAGLESKQCDASTVQAALDRLLTMTGARAAGIWRVEHDFLVQVVFRAVDEMPAEVREGFRAATRQLPLTRTDLGIVKAAVTGHPTPAVLPEKTGDVTIGDLGGSATWLERFACRQSLAVPIYRNRELLGVIAISTPERFGEASRTWAFLIDLANQIGERSAT
ncbi:MAG: GAF domain-containing protein [Planctomycetaceae bacterium]